MGNTSSSNSKVHYSKKSKVSSIEQHVPRQIMASFRSKQDHRNRILRDDENIGKHKVDTHTPLDNDETFNNFIKRAKYKIRTVTMSKSNIDREHSNNTGPAAPDHEANGDNYNKDNYQRDHFDDFIQIAKKKMRASSSIRNNSFLKKP